MLFGGAVLELLTTSLISETLNTIAILMFKKIF